MRPSRFLATGFLSLVVCAMTARAGSSPERHILGRGTVYETPYYVFPGDGPTILFEGGIHGSEPAGSYALDRIVDSIAIEHARLIVIPRMNRPADRIGERYVNVDLNRSFGVTGRSEPYEYALANEITDLVGREHVDYVITLHESLREHNDEYPSNLGQSVCTGNVPEPDFVDAWLARINRTIAQRRLRFVKKYYPIPGSSTEVLVAKYRLKGFCVETWRDLPLRQRIAMQFAALDTFLTTIGVKHRFQRD